LEDFLGEAHRYFREALEDFLAVVDPTTGEFPALMTFFTEGELLGQTILQEVPLFPDKVNPEM
jgi:lipopolysaccharide biosynthesis protein